MPNCSAGWNSSPPRLLPPHPAPSTRSLPSPYAKPMAGPPHVYLVRHGETEWTLTGQHTGAKTDIPLTDTGREQARTLCAGLTSHPFALVLSSPLSRALDTCRLAGF